MRQPKNFYHAWSFSGCFLKHLMRKVLVSLLRAVNIWCIMNGSDCCSKQWSERNLRGNFLPCWWMAGHTKLLHSLANKGRVKRRNPKWYHNVYDELIGKHMCEDAEDETKLFTSCDVKFSFSASSSRVASSTPKVGKFFRFFLRLFGEKFRANVEVVDRCELGWGAGDKELAEYSTCRRLHERLMINLD